MRTVLHLRRFPMQSHNGGVLFLSATWAGDSTDTGLSNTDIADSWFAVTQMMRSLTLPTSLKSWRVWVKQDGRFLRQSKSQFRWMV